MSGSSQNVANFPVTNVDKQVFVDVCTDKNMAYAAAAYRAQRGGTILAIYAVPEAEARYVTAIGAGPAPAPSGPTGTALPLPIAPAWIVISKAA